MGNYFLKILSMGITASYMIMAVIILRFLFRKAPKWIACFLWLMAGLRLICPFNIESTFSFIPHSADWTYSFLSPIIGEAEKADAEYEALYSENGIKGGAAGLNGNALGMGSSGIGANGNMQGMVNSGMDANGNVPGTVNHGMDVNGNVPGTVNSGIDANGNATGTGNPVMESNGNASETGYGRFGRYSKQRNINILTAVWLLGLLAMVLYLILSYIFICRKLRTATHFSGNVYECELVDSPFILGVIRPRIFIPYHMEEEKLNYVLAHENAHLKRGDHIFKLSAFLILCIYWFNPLVWAGYLLLSRDIELACDERVVRFMGNEEKKGYLLALLDCSTKKSGTNVCPLAFGEIGIKERVMRVKKFKKMPIWLMVIILVVCVSVLAGFLTNPKEDREVSEVEVPDKKEDVADEEIILTEREPSDSYTEKNEAEEGKSIEIKEVKPDSSYLSQDAGADGAQLYYADSKRIIFGGYFGLFVYDREGKRISSSLDLEYIGCNSTQGDNYCEIFAGINGDIVYMHPISRNELYIFDIEENTLKMREYENKRVSEDSSFDLFRINYDDGYAKAEYKNGQEERICALNRDGFGTIGVCSYMDWPMNGEGKAEYSLLFQPEGYEMAEGFAPEDIHDIVKVEMRIGGIMEKITDPDILRKIEEYLSKGEKLSELGVIDETGSWPVLFLHPDSREPFCPYINPLYITRKDNITGVIWHAEDDCNVFISEKGCFYMEMNKKFWDWMGDWKERKAG